MNAAAKISPALPLLWFGNTLVTVNVPSASGADGICVIEHRMPHGDSPPLHVHRNEDEVFHILAGAIRFVVGGEERMAGPGDTLLAPKGVPHTYRVESREGAHCLTVTTGPDFERLVRQTSRPAAAPGLPPEAAPTPEAIALLTARATENGIDIVGPPLA